MVNVLVLEQPPFVLTVTVYVPAGAFVNVLVVVVTDDVPFDQE